MSEFHEHRFIVGVHLVGLFLAPIGLVWIIDQLFSKIRFMIQDSRLKNLSHKSSIINLKSLYSILVLLSVLCLLPSLYKQTLSYATYNDTLILKANEQYTQEIKNTEELITTLQVLQKEHPGRVFAGRGGSWGKTFAIADTPYFMQLSAYGLPTVLWLPETWSLNSDVEQYFSEENELHYQIFGIRYVVTPNDFDQKNIQPFWTLLKENPSWKLYEITNYQLPYVANAPQGKPITNGKNKLNSISNSSLVINNYISVGVSPSVVFSDKESFASLIRLWLHSLYPSQSIYPELHITDKNLAPPWRGYFPNKTNLPHFFMINESTYQTPDGKTHSLMNEPPVYINPVTSDKLQVTSENQKNPSKFLIPNSQFLILNSSSDSDMVFRATVQVSTPSSSIINSPSSPPILNTLSSTHLCKTCVVILKQTYHPNWKATVNGKKVDTIAVFPFHTAIRLEEPGVYEVIFRYEPSQTKILLFLFSTLLSITILFFFLKK